MGMSTQILTATHHLDPVELERLALHNFRAPNMDNLEFMTIEQQAEAGVFTEDYIRAVMDIESVTYYRHGDFVYGIVKHRYTEHLAKTVLDLLAAEQQMGEPLGLIESDSTSLTATFVYHAKDIEMAIQVHTDIVLECTKRAFYL